MRRECRLRQGGGQMKRKAGFSMIELLVVIAVIGILAGILLPVLSKVRERGKVAATMAVIKNLEVAIRQYDLDFGQFPPDANAAAAGLIPAEYDTGAECLVYFLGTPFRRLPTKTNEVKSTKNGGPYFEFKDDQLADVGEEMKVIVDYWGLPYEYDNLRDDQWQDCSTFAPDPRGGAGKNMNSFDLWSFGPSGGSNPKTIIGNFKP